MFGSDENSQNNKYCQMLSKTQIKAPFISILVMVPLALLLTIVTLAYQAISKLFGLNTNYYITPTCQYDSNVTTVYETYRALYKMVSIYKIASVSSMEMIFCICFLVGLTVFLSLLAYRLFKNGTENKYVEPAFQQLQTEQNFQGGKVQEGNNGGNHETADHPQKGDKQQRKSQKKSSKKSQKKSDKKTQKKSQSPQFVIQPQIAPQITPQQPQQPQQHVDPLNNNNQIINNPQNSLNYTHIWIGSVLFSLAMLMNFGHLALSVLLLLNFYTCYYTYLLSLFIISFLSLLSGLLLIASFIVWQVFRYKIHAKMTKQFKQNKNKQNQQIQGNSQAGKLQTDPLNNNTLDPLKQQVMEAPDLDEYGKEFLNIQERKQQEEREERERIQEFKRKAIPIRKRDKNKLGEGDIAQQIQQGNAEDEFASKSLGKRPTPKFPDILDGNMDENAKTNNQIAYEGLHRQMTLNPKKVSLSNSRKYSTPFDLKDQINIPNIQPNVVQKSRTNTIKQQSVDEQQHEREFQKRRQSFLKNSRKVEDVPIYESPIQKYQSVKKQKQIQQHEKSTKGNIKRKESMDNDSLSKRKFDEEKSLNSSIAKVERDWEDGKNSTFKNEFGESRNIESFGMSTGNNDKNKKKNKKKGLLVQYIRSKYVD